MSVGVAISARAGATPVSLAEIKAHVRQDHSADDTVLVDLVTAAVEATEDASSEVLQESTLVVTLDRWPVGGVIEVPRYPIQAVDSITYLEEGGSSPTTLSSSLYRVDTASKPPRIVLKANQTWPSASLEYGAPITITCTAGYADGFVPERAKQAVKLLVGHWYANREAVVSGTITAEFPESWRSLALRGRLW